MSQQWEWVRQIEGQQNDSSIGIDIDDSGNVYVVGRSKFAVTFHDEINPISPTYYGYQDIFVSKYNPNGNLIWANVAGAVAVGYDMGYGVVADNMGGCYIVGMANDSCYFGQDTLFTIGDTDASISRIDANGNFIWTRSIGAIGTDRGHGVAIDSTGNIIWCGYITGQAVVNGQTIGTVGKSNGFICKIDPDGNFIAVKHLNSNYYSTIHKVEIGVNGDIYIAGGYSGTTYFDGVPAVAVGTSWPDAFIAKYDSSLNFIWQRNGGSAYHDITYNIALHNNHIYSTGVYTGTANFSGTLISYNATAIGSSAINNARDIFVSKYDLDGNLIWIKGFGNQGFDEAYGIDISDDGNIYISGFFEDTVSFDNIDLTALGVSNPDMFAARLDSNGVVVWVKQTGNGLSTHASEVGIDKYQNIYVVGEYYQTVDFDTIQLETNGQRDAFVGKITQPTYPITSYPTTVSCVDDTLIVHVDLITSPNSISWNISNNGWSVGDDYFLVCDNDTVIVEGYVLTSNYFYQDTTWISDTLYLSSPEMTNWYNNYTVCNGDSVLLFAPLGQYSYQWSSGMTGNDQFAGPGLIWCSWINNEGCASSDTTEILLSEIDTVMWANEYLICPADSFLLNAPENQSSYLWSTGQVDQQIYINTSGGVWCTWINGDGCLSTDSTTMVEIENLNLIDEDSIFFCQDSSTLVFANSNCIYYNWSNGESGVNLDTVVISGQGILSLFAEDSNACIFSDSIFLQHFPSSSWTLGDDTISCDPSILLSGPSGFDYYEWSSGLSGTNEYELMIFESGTIELVVTDTFGCISGDSITVNLLNCAGYDNNSLNTGITVISAVTEFIIIAPEHISDIIIFNSSGQLILDDNPNSCYVLIDVTSYPSGIYFIQCRLLSDSIETLKIMVE